MIKDRFRIEIEQVSTDAKALARELADEHHELQAGIRNLQSILRLMQLECDLDPNSRADLISGYERALRQVLPSLEWVNQLYTRARDA